MTVFENETRNETRMAKQVLGIIGGLGPLASAEFVRTLYQFSSGHREQDAPVVLLASDPTFPDRTEALLAGRERELAGRLIEVIERLLAAGADRLVLCCVTLHHVVPTLPSQLRQKLLSLIDEVAAELRTRQGTFLLLTTTGTRKLGIFERHENWGVFGPRLTLPSEEDQDIVHQLIYRLKRGEEPARETPLLLSMVEKYGASGFVAGCTELHLVCRMMEKGGIGRDRFIDPLTSVASRWVSGCP